MRLLDSELKLLSMMFVNTIPKRNAKIKRPSLYKDAVKEDGPNFLCAKALRMVMTAITSSDNIIAVRAIVIHLGPDGREHAITEETRLALNVPCNSPRAAKKTETVRQLRFTNINITIVNLEPPKMAYVLK